ncbi:hypothetical protein [Variovorax sp. HJSM1_2]|uniref:hypothetical protein n=1 Tax=Variovorax sp. HJSM1_2 TaxID=3366263 RepID=UPI003BEB592B
MSEPYAQPSTIQALKERIAELENQLVEAQQDVETRRNQIAAEAVRNLRSHGVILVYVGEEDFSQVCAEASSTLPLLHMLKDDVRLLRNAPVSPAAKEALFDAAQHLLHRWQ